MPRHPFGGVAAHRGHPVRVPIEDELNAGVPGEVLDVLRVRAASEQGHEGAVPASIDTTLTPPGTQYGATQGKPEKRKPVRNGGFASLGKPLQRMNYHS
jgi:hypothetical protein